MKTMKTSIDVIQNEIGKPESLLKRTIATKLDVALLVDHIQTVNSGTLRDLDSNQKQLRQLEDKVLNVDTDIHTIGDNIIQCQNVILSVKDTLDVQTRSLMDAFKETEREHEERFAAIDEKMDATADVIRSLDDRMNTVADGVRSVDEKHTQRFEEIHSRILALEERLPQLSVEVKALGSSVERLAQVQAKINVRILTVMRMSLLMVGVLVAATAVVGWIFFKH
jgi:chromosome segregation ATPase